MLLVVFSQGMNNGWGWLENYCFFSKKKTNHNKYNLFFVFFQMIKRVKRILDLVRKVFNE